MYICGMNLSHVLAIIKKDIDIELRQKYAIGGTFLFAITSAYIIYKSFGELKPMEWNILVWIIVLYAGLNAIVKTFIQEKKETYLYYYTLFGPLEVIVAKLIYNYLFTLFLSFTVIGVFTVLLGNPIKDVSLFMKALLLGALGISSVFTFVSSVSGSSSSSSTMMSILSLPLVLPSVLIMERTTAVAMRLINDSEIYEDLVILGGIDLLLIGMIILIFPGLWKE
ncbi:MAG: heme exporter protein B [Saprospiraceae bacterium]|jgi:heme exporter protein B